MLVAVLSEGKIGAEYMDAVSNAGGKNQHGSQAHHGGQGETGPYRHAPGPEQTHQNCDNRPDHGTERPEQSAQQEHKNCNHAGSQPQHVLHDFKNPGHQCGIAGGVEVQSVFVISVNCSDSAEEVVIVRLVNHSKFNLIDAGAFIKIEFKHATTVHSIKIAECSIQ